MSSGFPHTGPGLEREPNVACPVLDHELSSLATSLLIVGVFLLGTVLATLAGILVTCCYCRRKKNTKEKRLAVLRTSLCWAKGKKEY